MTLGEHFQKLIDSCTDNARAALERKDTDMVIFWLNAKTGITKRRNALIIQELEQQYTA